MRYACSGLPLRLAIATGASTLVVSQRWKVHYLLYSQLGLSAWYSLAVKALKLFSVCSTCFLCCWSQLPSKSVPTIQHLRDVDLCHLNS
ncbi:hypothetical protein Tco_0318931 [Tanacetum coccineum]